MAKKKSKCEFCGAVVPEGCSRCGKCDTTYWEGHSAGEKTVRREIGKIFRDLRNLSLEEK